MNYISTRNKYNISDNNFSKITMEGLAPDGGLYVPDNFPFLSSKEIYKMANLSYSELFTEIIYKKRGFFINFNKIFNSIIISVIFLWVGKIIVCVIQTINFITIT